MVNLTKASRELFSRTRDERFHSFDELLAHCNERRERSSEYWQLSQQLCIEHSPEGLRILNLTNRSFIVAVRVPMRSFSICAVWPV